MILCGFDGFALDFIQETADVVQLHLRTEETFEANVELTFRNVTIT